MLPLRGVKVVTPERHEPLLVEDAEGALHACNRERGAPHTHTHDSDLRSWCSRFPEARCAGEG
eukprot:5951658-Pyramimonas_sp.AAC.1